MLLFSPTPSSFIELIVLVFLGRIFFGAITVRAEGKIWKWWHLLGQGERGVSKTAADGGSKEPNLLHPQLLIKKLEDC